ncbi:hypothetical protein [Pedobacter sp.]|uniref:hypothetical protein n=1 Tax=Pedobacter sp. TaxID=1411316 RepID=UPI003D7F718F
MKIISTREFRNETKTYFELAEKERVAVKRGKKFVNFIVTNEPDSQFFSEAWIKEFLAIPEKYRCNPFDISSSGDLYWADKRNIEQLKNRLNETSEGNPVTVKTPEDLKSFLDSL